MDDVSCPVNARVLAKHQVVLYEFNHQIHRQGDYEDDKGEQHTPVKVVLKQGLLKHRKFNAVSLPLDFD